MEIDLKLCRFESAPWGFRLIGGSDFELPLTVVKVKEESLAEQAGMREGDIILKINDEPTEGKTHTEIQQIIGHCGNNFFITVYREENQNDIIYTDEYMEVAQSSEVHEIHETTCHEEEVIQSVCSETVTQTNGIELEECIDHITEAEIADLMSGESEVLKEHNVIGVNFNRIFPKPGVCKSSEVFRTLNDEAIKTKADQEKEKRKWTTFLQKPDRPIPKSKQELEKERNYIPYKVQIVKQPKPRVAPDRTPSPPPVIPEPEPEPEKPPTPEVVEEEPVEPPTDSEVPNLEPTEGALTDPAAANDDNVNEGQINEEASQVEEQEPTDPEPAPAPEPPQKTEEEIMFAKQLTDIQRQLLALSSLPSTIQATLDAVSKQLCELMPNIQLDLPAAVENVNKVHEATQPEQSLADGENNENTDETSRDSTETTQETVVEVSDHLEVTEESTVRKEEISEHIESHTTESRQESHMMQQMTQERSFREESYEYEEEEFAYEEHKSKSQQQIVMKELEHKQRLIKERASKRPPKAFGPLTPQERPLVLPGGRKWRKPKDAFNDEFIADILSSQAELIVGSTLGTTFESNNLGFDQRVNFLKYKKPEKHIDLEKSEVYKVIHDLDHSPRHGIECRPARVVAEADVRNGAS